MIATILSLPYLCIIIHTMVRYHNPFLIRYWVYLVFILSPCNKLSTDVYFKYIVLSTNDSIFIMPHMYVCVEYHQPYICVITIITSISNVEFIQISVVLCRCVFRETISSSIPIAIIIDHVTMVVLTIYKPCCGNSSMICIWIYM